MKESLPTACCTPSRSELATVSFQWDKVGFVQAVYSRGIKKAAPERLLEVNAMARYGIVGDVHACPHSPRQLMVAGDASYAQFALSEGTLRENLRIDFSTTALNSGDLLRIGSSVVLWMTFHCEPCALLERRRPGITKAIGTHRGMLARVLAGGTFGIGNEVALARAVLPAMSNDWRERVLHVARAVPQGRHITYRDLAEMAGVAQAYCRAFPRILSTLPLEISNRIVTAKSMLLAPRWDGAELFDRHVPLDLSV